MRVLVCDDEMIIRRKIVRNLKKLDYISEIYEAENGAKGIEIIKEMPVDLVVTDIKMPKMTGLEMIEKGKTLNEDLKFIIISGFGEFSYAKKGIELGASDYILKPIEEENLISIVENIHKKYVEENKEKATKINLVNQSEFLKEIMNYSKDEHYNALILIEGYEQNEYKILEKYIEKNSLLAKYIEDVSKKHMIVLVLSDDVDELKESIIKFINSMDMDEVPKWEIGISSITKNITYKNFTQCLTAIKWRKYRYKERVYMFKRIDKVIKCYNENIVDLIEGINSKNYDDFYEKLKELDRFKDDEYGCYSVIDIIEKIRMQLEIHEIKNNDSGERNDSGSWKEYHEYDGIDEYLLDVRERFKVDSKDIDETQYKTIIVNVKKYIEENYAKDLKVKSLEKQFFLNAYYLSYTFKNAYGIPINEYITELRMKKAKELLRKTNLSSKEICFQIGYKDPQYFFRIFKKKVGCTPKSYKENSA